MILSLCMVILLGFTMTATAQIERKPLAVNSDTIAAQSPGPGKTDWNKNRKDRLQGLDLTKEQRAKLKEIRQSGHAAKDAIENNTALSDADKKKQLRKLQRGQAGEIQAILTEDQQAKFKAGNQNNP